jgi:RHH-type transcriptional regulator, proline utilization regulon repressor / proline dehydrogenase / delta 1-pyrroline-5-carboxylate dehydrogenase
VKQVMEQRIQRIGHELWDELQGQLSSREAGWIDRLLGQLLADSHFRLQALRFVDAAPALRDDGELVRHFEAYFHGMDFDELPSLLSWGIEHGSGISMPALMAPAIRKAVKGVAHRFIAGETTADILKVVRNLSEQGIGASLDRLGEATLSEAEAQVYQQAYLDLIAQASQRDERVADLNLSIKISSLYSQISAADTEGSIQALAERLRPILLAAMSSGISITLDMEQYDYKEIILRLFMEIGMEEPFRHWPGLGLAVQAYLRETDEDLEQLIDWVAQRGTRVMVRLVRGAYWDQESVIARQQGWSLPVWPTKGDTDACYERALDRLFATPLIRPAVATHNLRSIARALALAEAYARQADSYEFQMLYGMSQDLAPLVIGREQRLRLYLPFGELLPGIAYLVRRLLENSSDQSLLPALSRLDREQVLAPPQPQAAAEVEAAWGFVNQPLHRFTQPAERAAFRQALDRVTQALGGIYPLHLARHIAVEEHYIESTNPAIPSQRVGRVVRAGPDDAEMAIRQAERAFDAWSSLSMRERAAHLERASELLAARRDSFAAWEVKEAGKSWIEADGDVAEAIDFLRYYARQARLLAKRGAPSVPGEQNRLEYHPLGIGVILPPWNFPLAIPVGMLAAAIVCGNCAILKPASETPVVAWHFCELLRVAGLPEGVVTCLPGSGAEIGEALVRDPRTHFIAFTGSRVVGLQLQRITAEQPESQHHVKRLIAEMGGKNAIIIDADADLDDAVAGVIESAFGFQGQKCSACSRVICVGEVHDPFVRRLVEAARSLRIGDPTEPGNRMGPVINAAAKQRILQVIEASALTASTAFIGELPAGCVGHFVPPVIFTDVPEDSPLAQEEIFGPVLAVLRAKDFDAALGIANGTAYALTGGVYSRSPAHLELASARFMVGNLYLNRKITRAMVQRQPFGGFKLSGMGFKAGGPDYLLQFLHARSVTENTLRRGFAPDVPGD